METRGLKQKAVCSVLWQSFVCVGGGLQVYICTHVCGGQRSTSSVFLNCSPSYFWGQTISLNPELAHLARFLGGNKPYRSVYTSPVLGPQICRATLGCWGSELGSLCLCSRHFTNGTSSPAPSKCSFKSFFPTLGFLATFNLIKRPNFLTQMKYFSPLVWTTSRLKCAEEGVTTIVFALLSLLCSGWAQDRQNQETRSLDLSGSCLCNPRALGEYQIYSCLSSFKDLKTFSLSELHSIPGVDNGPFN